MPSRWYIVASRSLGETGRSATSPRDRSVAPTTWPRACRRRRKSPNMPATSDRARRPSRSPIFGVRPCSLMQTTSVSSSRPRLFQVEDQPRVRPVERREQLILHPRIMVASACPSAPPAEAVFVPEDRHESSSRPRPAAEPPGTTGRTASSPYRSRIAGAPGARRAPRPSSATSASKTPSAENGQRPRRRRDRSKSRRVESNCSSNVRRRANRSSVIPGCVPVFDMRK